MRHPVWVPGCIRLAQATRLSCSNRRLINRSDACRPVRAATIPSPPLTQGVALGWYPSRRWREASPESKNWLPSMIPFIQWSAAIKESPDQSRHRGLKLRQIDITVFLSARHGVVDNFPKALIQGKRQGLKVGVVGDRYQRGARPAVLGYQHRTALGQLLDVVAKPRFDLANVLDFHSITFLSPITS